MSLYVIFIAVLHTVPVLLASFIFSSRLITFIAALFMVLIALNTGAERYGTLDAIAVVGIWLRLFYIESKTPDSTEEESTPEKESDSLDWIALLFIVIAIVIVIAGIVLLQSSSNVALTPSTTYQPQQYNSNQTPELLTPIYPVVDGNTNQKQEPIQTPREDYYLPPLQPEHNTSDFTKTSPNRTAESIQKTQKPIVSEVKQKSGNRNEAYPLCEYKGVMTDEDYYKCGLSPPKILTE